MIVYVVRHSDLLDMEGSPDVAEVFLTEDKAHDYVKAQKPHTSRSGKPLEEWYVEPWAAK